MSNRLLFGRGLGDPRLVPTGPVRLIRGHRLAPKELWVPGSIKGLAPFVGNGPPLVAGSAVSIADAGGGPGLWSNTLPSAGTGAIQCPYQPGFGITNTNQGTLLWKGSFFGTLPSSTGGFFIIGVEYSEPLTSPYSTLDIYFQSTNELVAGVGWPGGAYATGTFVPSTQGFANFTLGMTADLSGNILLYYNGTLLVSNSATPAAIEASPTATFYLGNDVSFSSTSYLCSQIGLIDDRPWTAEEIAEWHDAPFSMLESDVPQTFLFPIATSGLNDISVASNIGAISPTATIVQTDTITASASIGVLTTNSNIRQTLMPVRYADRVLEQVVAPISGAAFAISATAQWQTSPAAVSSYQTFANIQGIAANDTITYFATDGTGAEGGIGTWSSGSLARTVILFSSNGGLAVSFTGTVTVFCTQLAEAVGGTIYLVSASGSAQTLTAIRGGTIGYDITLTANCALTLAGGAVGLKQTIYAWLRTGAGGFTLTLPSGVLWPNGTPPTPSTIAGQVNVFTFTTIDGGTTWVGGYF